MKIPRMRIPLKRPAPFLRGGLLRHLRLLADEPDYGDDGWSGSVSFLERGELTGLEGPPVSVDILDMQIESATLYDPQANGEWRLWFNEPSQYENAEPRDIADLQKLGPRPLVFWHFKCAEPQTRSGQEFDPEALRIRVSLYATVAALLANRQAPETSPAVRRFLQHYRDVPQKNAWFVQPLFLGANIPFKYWPCCVWIGKASPNGRDRLFSQPLTHEGFPLGLAWSWPVNDWAIDRFDLPTDDLPIATRSQPSEVEEEAAC